MVKIPFKIQQELMDETQFQWVEEQDRIYEETDLTDKLKIENQYLFWKKNCDIRMAFEDIEKLIKTTSKPSIRMGGWSEIARKAKCDRNTLKHSERFLWVNEARERLLTLIQNKNTRMKLEIALTEEDNIQKLKQEIELSKNESAKWFLKFEETNRENKLLRQALERQMAINTSLHEKLKNN